MGKIRSTTHIRNVHLRLIKFSQMLVIQNVCCVFFYRNRNDWTIPKHCQFECECMLYCFTNAYMCSIEPDYSAYVWSSTMPTGLFILAETFIFNFFLPNLILRLYAPAIPTNLIALDRNNSATNTVRFSVIVSFTTTSDKNKCVKDSCRSAFDVVVVDKMLTVYISYLEHASVYLKLNIELYVHGTCVCAFAWWCTCHVEYTAHSCRHCTHALGWLRSCNLAKSEIAHVFVVWNRRRIHQNMRTAHRYTASAPVRVVRSAYQKTGVDHSENCVTEYRRVRLDQYVMVYSKSKSCSRFSSIRKRFFLFHHQWPWSRRHHTVALWQRISAETNTTTSIIWILPR